MAGVDPGLRRGGEKRNAANFRVRTGDLRRLTRRRYKAVLVIGLIALGLVTLAKSGVALALLAIPNPQAALPGSFARGVLDIARAWAIAPPQDTFRMTDLGLETVIGLLFVGTAVLMVTRREQLATALGSLALLLSLTGVNLLTFPVAFHLEHPTNYNGTIWRYMAKEFAQFVIEFSTGRQGLPERDLIPLISLCQQVRADPSLLERAWGKLLAVTGRLPVFRRFARRQRGQDANRDQIVKACVAAISNSA